jgi:hypothetical protein
MIFHGGQRDPQSAARTGTLELAHGHQHALKLIVVGTVQRRSPDVLPILGGGERFFTYKNG